MKYKNVVHSIEIALYDEQRKGIFIHRDQLKGTGFTSGDRFSIHKGKRKLFALTIVKDDQGEIFYDKAGIFIPRTRRVDILMGGIFEAYTVKTVPEHPDRLIIMPLEEGTA